MDLPVPFHYGALSHNSSVINSSIRGTSSKNSFSQLSNNKLIHYSIWTMEVPFLCSIFNALFFCVSNIITKKKSTDINIFGVVLVVFLFSLSNIVILLLVDLNTGLNIELQDRRGEVLCLLSCLSFNKVGPPSSRRGTRQPTLWKMTLRFNIYKEM